MGGGLRIEIATLLLHQRNIKERRDSALNKHNSLFSFYKDNTDCTAAPHSCRQTENGYWSWCLLKQINVIILWDNVMLQWYNMEHHVSSCMLRHALKQNQVLITVWSSTLSKGEYWGGGENGREEDFLVSCDRDTLSSGKSQANPVLLYECKPQIKHKLGGKEGGKTAEKAKRDLNFIQMLDGGFI